MRFASLSTILLLASLLLALGCCSSSLLVCGASSPLVSSSTAPNRDWITDLNSTWGSTDPQWAPLHAVTDPDGIAVVVDQTLSVIDPVSGSVRFSSRLVTAPSSRCYAPVVWNAGSTARVFIPCTPNVLLAYSLGPSSTPLWNVTVNSSVPLPGAGDPYVPIWEQSIVLSSTGDLMLLASGSGCLFSLSSIDGTQVRRQLGPYASSLFGDDVAATSLQPVLRAQDDTVLFLLARGSINVSTLAIPAALLRFTVPTLEGASWDPWTEGTSYRFGNDTVPTAHFDALTDTPSGTLYVVLRFQMGALTPAGAPEADEVWAFAQDTTEPPVRWRSDALTGAASQGALGLQESPDGQFLLPLRAGLALPVLRSADGSLAAWWSLSGGNRTALRNCSVLLSGDNTLFLLSSSTLVGGPFDPASELGVGVAWAYDTVSVGARGAHEGFVSLLAEGQRPNALLLSPGAEGQPQNLLLYSSYEPLADGSLPSGAVDRLQAFSSAFAPSCDSLPDSGDCESCDALRGSRTARHCAYCLASSSCTQFLLPGLAPLGGSQSNATCADVGYPLAAEQCNGGPASVPIAIIVGVLVGVAIALSGLICYLAKRKPEGPAGYSDM